MARVCHFTGKRTRAGRSISRRGKAKYLGGVGRKITGISKRKFKPNIQRVRALVDGTVCRIKVSAKALRNGMVVKPPKRDWRPDGQTAGIGQVESAVIEETSPVEEMATPQPEQVESVDDGNGEAAEPR